MSSEYHPDGWVILKFTRPNGELIYKVFGSWSGGYASGASWKLNSGICSFDIDPKTNLVFFNGYSGSRYVCRREAEGRINVYNMGVVQDATAKEGIDQISFEQFLKEFVPNEYD